MSFDIEFEEAVLAECLRNGDFLKSASRVLDEHHFATRHHGWVWSVIKDNWLRHRELVTPKVIMRRARKAFADEDKRRPYLQLTLKLYKRPPEAPRSSLEELSEFVRFVRLQTAMEAGAEALEKGDVNKAMDSVRDAVTGDLRPSRFTRIKWVEEFIERQRIRKRRKEHPEEFVCIPTGIKPLDRIILGLAAGELGLVVGTTGRGKSIFLTHLGYHAALRGFRVVHFSLEMPAFQVATRYDSRFTGLAHRKFKTYDFTKPDFKQIAARMKRLHRRFQGRLELLSVPVQKCDSNALRAGIEEVSADGAVDMVIVDSGDHVQSVRRRDSYRLEQAEVYWGLKSIAEEMDVPVWTSTQAKQEEEKRVAGSSGVAEAYEKARIADLILTLNVPEARSRARVVEEGEEELRVKTPTLRPGRARIEAFLAKYRDGESNIRIPLDADFTRMIFQQAAREGGTV